MSQGRDRTLSPKTQLTAHVLGRDVVIDPDTLTMGERSQMKRVLAQLGYEPDDTDVLVGTIWVVMRRADPELTFEEVCDAITIADMDKMDAQVGGALDDPEG